MNLLINMFLILSRMSWGTGKTWGFRLHNQVYPFPKDAGALFIVTIYNQVLPSPPFLNLGHSIISSILHTNPLTPSPNLTAHRKTQTLDNQISEDLNPRRLLKATYEVVDVTYSEHTSHCCLCLNAKPPYYNSSAYKTSVPESAKVSSCVWWQISPGSYHFITN